MEGSAVWTETRTSILHTRMRIVHPSRIVMIEHVQTTTPLHVPTKLIVTYDEAAHKKVGYNYFYDNASPTYIRYAEVITPERTIKVEGNCNQDRPDMYNCGSALHWDFGRDAHKRIAVEGNIDLNSHNRIVSSASLTLPVTGNTTKVRIITIFLFSFCFPYTICLITFISLAHMNKFLFTSC